MVFLFSSIYDKRDVFNFSVVNFPFLSGNIPNRSSYGVFISQLVRYARGCIYIEDFNYKTKNTISKLSKQNFTPKMLKRSWSKFCRKHLLLIQKFGSIIFSLIYEWFQIEIFVEFIFSLKILAIFYKVVVQGTY